MNIYILAKSFRKRLCSTLFATLCAFAVTACSDAGDARERALVKLRDDYLQRLELGLTIGDPKDRRREIADVCGLLVQSFYTESANEFDQLRSWDYDEQLTEVYFCMDVTLSRVEEVSQDEHRRLADECAGATAKLSRLLCERARFF